MVAGSLVAGLDAGLTYNSYPLMDGKFIPDGLFQMSPFYVNFFDNIVTVQFDHRLMAKVTIALAALLWWQAQKNLDTIAERWPFDLLAALIDPSLNEHALGIFLGGLVFLPLIPFFEKYITKSKYHIIVGDHEEIKKDLKNKHK